MFVALPTTDFSASLTGFFQIPSCCDWIGRTMTRNRNWENQSRTSKHLYQSGLLSFDWATPSRWCWPSKMLVLWDNQSRNAIYRRNDIFESSYADPCPFSIGREAAVGERSDRLWICLWRRKIWMSHLLRLLVCSPSWRGDVRDDERTFLRTKVSFDCFSRTLWSLSFNTWPISFKERDRRERKSKWT